MSIQFVTPRTGALYNNPSSFFAADMEHINDVNYWSPYQSDEVCLIATFAVDSDGNPMFASYGREDKIDAFVIEDADEATKQLFREHKGRICVICILAYDLQGPFAQRGNKYDIDENAHVALLPLNPSVEAIAGMHHGSYFVIEGEYAGFTPKDFGGTWSIAVEDQIYLVEADSVKEPRFASGVLERLQNKAPIPGERVHMVVYRNTEHDCIKSVYDMPYLVTPHPSRQVAYNHLRAQIATLLRKVDSYLLRGQWRKARHLLAQIRFMECTFGEKQRVEKFQAKFPSREAPFWTPDSLYAKRFLRAFGVNLEHLTYSEVTEVARKVFDGRLVSQEDSRHTDPIVLLNHMVQEGMPDDHIISVVASGITGRFERLLKMLEGSEHDPFDRNCRFDRDCWSLDRSLHIACGYDNETLVSAVVSLIETYLFGTLSVGQRALLAYTCCEALKTIKHWQSRQFSSVQRVDSQKAGTWLTSLKGYNTGSYAETQILIEGIMRRA